MYILIILLHIIYITPKISYIINKHDIKYYLNNIYPNKNKIIDKLWKYSSLEYKNSLNLFIKYNNNYTVRSCIDFNNENLIVETINKKNIKKILRKEIINIFSNNFYNFHLKNDNFNSLSNKSFKYNLSKYSIFFFNIKKNIKKISLSIVNENLSKNIFNKNKTINYIKIKLISDNIILDKLNYINKIKYISNIYNIDYILVLSIINVESNFNPYAISKSGAIGLMQIMKNKSGIDVFKMLGKKGNPTIDYLFNINKNIKIGSAYIYILQNNYLSKVNDPVSLRYLTIASYNAGVDSVLKIFSNINNNSINIINSMSSKKIYNYIINHHPSSEIKKYLKKVNDTYIYYKTKNILY